jgi:hypothetical protein
VEAETQVVALALHNLANRRGRGRKVVSRDEIDFAIPFDKRAANIR